MKKGRGIFLTITLVIFTGLSIFGLYLAPTLKYQEIYQNAPSWLSTFVLINLFVDIAALIGVWLWRKMAVYVLIASWAIPLLMEVMILRVTDSGLGDALIGLFMHGFLFWSIFRRWKYFV